MDILSNSFTFGATSGDDRVLHKYYAKRPWVHVAITNPSISYQWDWGRRHPRATDNPSFFRQPQRERDTTNIKDGKGAQIEITKSY